jgi:catechol 2,3-dioxygenase-like lactoylglutathione lyase family enzyme
MKRLHVHTTVKNLDESVRFYSTLFGQQPTRHEPDYAKWMLEDPRVNFAISTWGGEPGIDHLGFQVDEEGELSEIAARLEQAGHAVTGEKNTTCCYAVSDKHWVVDPAGTPWETFRTMAQAKVRGASLVKDDAETAATRAAGAAKPAESGRCGTSGASACCA